jgi:hypothetical protein
MKNKEKLKKITDILSKFVVLLAFTSFFGLINIGFIVFKIMVLNHAVFDSIFGAGMLISLLSGALAIQLYRIKKKDTSEIFKY